MKREKKILLGIAIAIISFSLQISASEIEWAVVKKGDSKLQDPKFAVNYDYNIMKYEVTVEQYCKFLNAIAGDMDTYNLYDKRMRINREGMAFEYKYTVKKGYAKHPVTCINFPRAAIIKAFKKNRIIMFICYMQSNLNKYLESPKI